MIRIELEVSSFINLHSGTRPWNKETVICAIPLHAILESKSLTGPTAIIFHYRLREFHTLKEWCVTSPTEWLKTHSRRITFTLTLKRLLSARMRVWLFVSRLEATFFALKSRWTGGTILFYCRLQMNILDMLWWCCARGSWTARMFNPHSMPLNPTLHIDAGSCVLLNEISTT